MKIIAIRLKNINSLKGTHEIDFSKSPLKEAGLFAITGTTGSGKSTILDAITLALYNQIPRVQSRISKNFIAGAGMILTRNTTDGYAEVTYQCKSGTYISKWSISTARTGNLHDYNMEISPVETKEPLDLKKSDVPAENSRLTGLNYEQFVRAIILAQGDFASFLKAREDERGKLLEQITGGDIYRKLGKKAFEMYKQHGEVIEDKRKSLEQLQQLRMDESALKLLKEELQKLNQEAEALQKKEQNTRKAIELKKEVAALKITQEEIMQKSRTLQLEIEKFNNEGGIALKKHRTLANIQDSLQLWSASTVAFTDYKEDTEKLTAQGEKLKEQQDALQKQVGSFTKSLPYEPLKVLNEFQNKVLAHDQLISRKETELSQKWNFLNNYTEDEGIAFKGSAIEEIHAETRAKITEVNGQLESLSRKLAREVKADSSSALSNLRKTEGVVGELLRCQDKLESLADQNKQLEKKLSNLKTELKVLPEKIREQEALQQSAKLKHDNLRLELENRKLRSSLEEHRKELKPGEPCPLCGATEHPLFSEEPETEDHLKAAAEAAGEELEKATRILTELRSLLQNLSSQSAERTNEISSNKKQIADQDDQIKGLREQLPQAYRAMAIAEIKEKVASDINILESFIEAKKQQTALSRILQTASEITELASQRDKQQALRNKLYTGDNIQGETDKLKQSWNEVSANLKNNTEKVQDVKAKLQETREKLTTIENSLEKPLKELNYSSPHEALKDLLKSDAAEALRTKAEVLNQQEKENQTTAKNNLSRIEELKKKDTPENEEALMQLLQKVAGELKEKTQARDDRAATLKMEQEYDQRIVVLQTEINQLRDKNLKWNLLHKYIGDSEGKNFSTFAQRLTLYKLILLANKRLNGLNDRYLLDLPKEDEEEGISVIDTHMGDQRRSVKSLSGGETFLISLSLALALSDLAARNIKIESLFIDEGFGSLDKLTLDQTIDTLEKLQYESGKNIGIISHVEAMQERITTQIAVEKSGQGYSKITIL